MLVSTWLMQVKTMRALQYFPTIEDPNTRRSLFEVLLLLKDIFFCHVSLIILKFDFGISGLTKDINGD